MTRIMVIDDEPLICQLLTYQLREAGYYVTAASTGYEGLERLLTDQPDLVLLDVVMPDMSGWDVCRQMRACSAVPIIMLTAKSADTDVVAGLDIGADDYISKPFSQAQLLARIEAVLRRTRAAVPVAAGAGAAAVRARQPLQPAVSARVATHALRSPARVAVPMPGGARAAPVLSRRLGQHFAEARKLRGLTLHQAEVGSGIRWELLQAIEREHYGYIPRHQLRSLLKRYGDFLGVDLKKTQPPPSWFDIITDNVLAFELIILAAVFVVITIIVLLPPA